MSSEKPARLKSQNSVRLIRMSWVCSRSQSLIPRTPRASRSRMTMRSSLIGSPRVGCGKTPRPPHPPPPPPPPPDPLSADSRREHGGPWRRGGGRSEGWGERSSPHPSEILSPPPAGLPTAREPARAGGGARGGGSMRGHILFCSLRDKINSPIEVKNAAGDIVRAAQQEQQGLTDLLQPRPAAGRDGI